MSSAIGGICLSLALGAGSPVVFVPLERFTLAWTHSIERVRWEEDYAVVPDGARWQLLAVQTRIKGSGAGMEPPPDAQWRGGWYVYAPANRHPAMLTLSRSAFVPDYELCTAEGCRPLADHLPSDGGTTVVRACGANALKPPSESESSG